jgi:cytochrome c553
LKLQKITIVAAALFVMVFSVAAVQNDPPKFKNLKILPKDISPEALDKIMDDFNFALGVRCGYCHERNDSTKHLDFASDAKSEKEIARKMMTMTYEINNKYFNFDNSKDTPTVVTCRTCHRGNAFPVTDTMPPRKHD